METNDESLNLSAAAYHIGAIERACHKRFDLVNGVMLLHKVVYFYGLVACDRRKFF